MIIQDWLTRRLIDRCLDEDAPLPPKVQRRLERSPRLRRYYLTQRRLITGLRDEAPQALREPSPFLTGNIMRAIDQVDVATELNDAWEPGQPIRVSNWASLIASAAAAACLVFVISRVVIDPPFPGSGIRQASELAPDIAQSDFQAASAQVKELVEMADGGRLPELDALVHQPLEKELELALNDARNAVSALASSLLPTQLMQSAGLSVAQ